MSEIDDWHVEVVALANLAKGADHLAVRFALVAVAESLARYSDRESWAHGPDFIGDTKRALQAIVHMPRETEPRWLAVCVAQLHDVEIVAGVGACEPAESMARMAVAWALNGIEHEDPIAEGFMSPCAWAAESLGQVGAASSEADDAWWRAAAGGWEAYWAGPRSDDEDADQPVARRRAWERLDRRKRRKGA